MIPGLDADREIDHHHLELRLAVPTERTRAPACEPSIMGRSDAHDARNLILFDDEIRHRRLERMGEVAQRREDGEVR
jgi:hypothetical protein